MEAQFTRPHIKEVILKDNTHDFFSVVERSNRIILSEELKDSFNYTPITSFILSGQDLLPQTALTFGLAGHGGRWHRDIQYPILGIYKPLGCTRIAATLFTLSSGLVYANLSTLTEETYIRNDYNDPNVSKLTLFTNTGMKDGSYLLHKRECKYDTESNVLQDKGKTFSIKVENAIHYDEIEYD